MTFRDMRAEQVKRALKSCGVIAVQTDYITHEYRYLFELDDEEHYVCVPFSVFDELENADIKYGVSYSIYLAILNKTFEKHLKRTE